MKKSEVYVDVAIAGELERAELEPQLQQSIKNKEIINSLAQNPSKLGGSGGGIPDAIFEFYANGAKWFGIIENKSGKNAMGKLTDRGFIDNFNKDGTIAYKNKVAKFALNGAYYYAKNCYRDTSYKNYLVIGVCGYEEFGEYKLDISCYVLNNETGGEAIYFDNFKDLSFLHPNNREGTMKKIAQVHLTEEQKDEIRIKSEMSVQSALSTLNEKMWTEYGIDAKWRINVFVSMVLSGLGGDGIEKLQVDDLRGSTEDGSTDADLILRKIKNLLDARGVPATKVRSILLEIERTIKSNTQFNTTGGKSET
ncbi:MAG: hypothetical protein FWB98_08600, partial [Defluviitaleaceae bacterium]|nr:hypothetical protein [Defluviitaleaceae bacterium]